MSGASTGCLSRKISRRLRVVVDPQVARPLPVLAQECGNDAERNLVAPRVSSGRGYAAGSMTITGEKGKVKVLITVDGGAGPAGAGDPSYGDNEEPAVQTGASSRCSKQTAARENVGPAVRAHRRQRQPYVDGEPAGNVPAASARLPLQVTEYTYAYPGVWRQYPTIYPTMSGRLCQRLRRGSRARDPMPDRRLGS